MSPGWAPMWVLTAPSLGTRTDEAADVGGDSAGVGDDLVGCVRQVERGGHGTAPEVHDVHAVAARLGYVRRRAGDVEGRTGLLPVARLAPAAADVDGVGER